MPGSPAQGVFSRFFAKPGASPYTWDGSSERWEFYRGNPKKKGSIIYPPGIRGERQKSKERARLGPHMITTERPLQMAVDPGMLDIWLPRWLGAAESLDTFDLAELLPAFGLLFNMADTQTHELKDCKVDSWMIHGLATGPEDNPLPIDVSMRIYGLTEALGTPAPNVALSIADSAAPYTFGDVTFDLQGDTSREVKEFWLTGVNHLQPRFVCGSLTPVSLHPRDLDLRLTCRVPYDTDNDDLHDLPIAGAAGVVTMANGGMQCTWQLGNVKAPPSGPVIVGRTETDLFVEFEIYKNGTTPALRVINDPVP